MSNNNGVLVLYSGGTIGCVPSDPTDPESPLVVLDWDKFETQVPALQLIKEKFPVDGYNFNPPIDSSNMEPRYWQEMVSVIQENYDKYEGFVIVHGTDTMVYTASALSFMLINLGKPVIITGSQIPIIGESRTDGEQNLITSIMIANPSYYGLPVVPEVCIFFRDKLLRGNRTIKVTASGYMGFDSPNYPPLGEAGEHIVINDQFIRRVPQRAFLTKKRLNTNVIAMPLFPGIQSENNELMAKVLELDGLEAVVLQAYGTGNAPTTEKFLDEIATATGQQITVLDVTQCPQGMVEMGVYETSVALLDKGVVSGSDITAEAALCKLMVLLGDEDLSHEEINDMVQTNLAGEQSRSIFPAKYPKKITTITTKKDKNRKRLPAVVIASDWTADKLEMAHLRLRQAVLKSKDQEVPLSISIYVNISSDDDLDTKIPGYAGTFLRRIDQVADTLIFNITDTIRESVHPGERVSVTIALVGEDDQSLKWQQAELVLYVKQ